VTKDYGDALWRMAGDFPDDEASVLPTKFGNTIRAFEVYSRVVYGIESIYGWSRLLGVGPADYPEMMDNEKAQVDFWVNVWFESCLIVLVYGALAAVHSALPAPWIPLVAAV